MSGPFQYISESSQMGASYRDGASPTRTPWLFRFMNYLPLTKIRVWTITPKHFGLIDETSVYGKSGGRQLR